MSPRILREASSSSTASSSTATSCVSSWPEGRVVCERKGFPRGVGEEGRKTGRAGDELPPPAGHRRVLLVNDDMFLRFPIEVTVEPGKSLRIDPPLPEMGKLSVQAY